MLPVAIGISEGGGIATVGTTVEITDSVVANNRCALGGGGINAIDSQISIFNSSITDNFGLDAGAISAVNSTINLETIEVTNNRTGIFEGSGAIKLDSDSVLNLNHSVISDNFGEKRENPLPPGSQAFAAGIGNAGVANISNSTISNNTGIGFGVRNSGELDVINSTFSGNDSAGINSQDGKVTLSNSTISDNITGFSPDGDNSTATITSSILVNDSEEIAIDDRNNLTGNFSNLLLGELQDNGGSTETIALLEDSPAIDAGNNLSNLAFDQRGVGFDRTVGDGTDIGAYEVQGNKGGEMHEDLIVSTLEDENDSDYSEGDLSLREAISLANDREGADTITFDGNLSGNIVLDEGELTIADSLTIDGNNGQSLSIDGNNSSRVFKIDDGNSATNADVTLDGLTVINGNVANRETDNTGGGIFNQENLTLIRSTIADSSAEQGGGIANQGNLTLQSSHVDNNYAFEAGGIYTISGINRIIDSSINNNESNFNSGGLLVDNATIDIDYSTIDGNSTGAAYGGINIGNSIANINNSSISNNNGGGSVGGISSSSSITTINNSTIAGNTAASNGGMTAGSRGDDNEAIVTINNSTITGNSATVNEAGGVKNFVYSTMNINNSTITDNYAARGVAGVYQQESFIAPDDLPEDVIISGTLNLSSSIVAGNEGDRDLAGDSFNSGGNNLIGNGDGFSEYFNESLGDLVGTADNSLDPKLGELQDNGGSTQTISLLEDSPAIDAGNNNNNLATDQRGEGFARTVGNGTDIGAYELQTIIGDEEIIGTEKSDRLRGTSADDTIRGLGGSDLICGFKGHDAIYGDGGNDILFGNKGDDFLDGSDGRDRISGGSGVDTIKDGAGNDILLGGTEGDIFLASNGGDDLFRGGAGSDLYVYDLNAGFFDRDRVHDFKQREDKVAFGPVVDGDELNSFDDLDTNNSGILDRHDERVQILGHSTAIDFSDVFGRDLGSDTITLSANNLNSDNFIFDEAIIDTEFS